MLRVNGKAELVAYIAKALTTSSVTLSSLAGGGKQIVRLVVGMPPVPLLSWLAVQDDPRKFYWSDREDDTQVAGVGIADLVVDYSYGSAADALGELSKRVDRYNLLPSHWDQDANMGLRYYGGMRFDVSSTLKADSAWRPFGGYRFVLPRVEMHKDPGGQGCGFVLNAMLDKDNNDLDLLIGEVIGEVEALTFPESYPEYSFPPITSCSMTPAPKRWDNMMSGALNAIRAGKMMKVVLARRKTVEYLQNISPPHVVDRLRRFPDKCFCFLVQLNNDIAFLGASPELSYSRRGRHIKCEAVAGTRPRGDSVETDIDLGEELLASDKDRREHEFVARSIENALRECAKSFDRDIEGPRLLKLTGVQHLATTYCAELLSDVSDQKLLNMLSPGPAVGGYPKDAAIESIAELEPFDRGWYAGVVGWVGADSADFAVAIRSGLVDGPRLHMFAGAGILEGSQPWQEWQEVESKFSKFFRALN